MGRSLKQKATAVKTQEEMFSREGVGRVPGEKAVRGVWPDLDVCVCAGRTLRNACVGISVLRVAEVS